MPLPSRDAVQGGAPECTATANDSSKIYDTCGPSLQHALLMPSLLSWLEAHSALQCNVDDGVQSRALVGSSRGRCLLLGGECSGCSSCGCSWSSSYRPALGRLGWRSGLAQIGGQLEGGDKAPAAVSTSSAMRWLMADRFIG